MQIEWTTNPDRLQTVAILTIGRQLNFVRPGLATNWGCTRLYILEGASAGASNLFKIQLLNLAGSIIGQFVRNCILKNAKIRLWHSFFKIVCDICWLESSSLLECILEAFTTKWFLFFGYHNPPSVCTCRQGGQLGRPNLSLILMDSEGVFRADACELVVGEGTLYGINVKSGDN